MMIQYGLWGFMLLLIAGCNRIGDTFSETNEIEIIHINPNEVTEVKVSDLFSEIRYLKLESPEGEYFGGADNILIYANRIYILDLMRSNNISVFNMDGSFVKAFKMSGQGPGEFLAPHSISIDADGNRLGIYCDATRKIVLYDLETLTYLSEIKVDFSTSKFSFYKQSLVFHNNHLLGKIVDDKFFDILFTSENMELQSAYLEISKNKYGIHLETGNPFFNNYNTDNLYFLRPYDRNVYLIEDGQLKAYYEIDFGEFNLLEEYFDQWQVDRKRADANYRGKIHSLHNALIGDHIDFFTYRYDRRNHYLIRLKSEDGRIRTVHTSFAKMIKDIDIYITLPLTMYNDEIVWSGTPRTLLRNLREKEASLSPQEWAEYQRVNRDLIEFSKTVSSNDNPYLIFTKLAIWN